MKEPRGWKIDPLLEPNASIALFIYIEGLQENALCVYFSFMLSEWNRRTCFQNDQKHPAIDFISGNK
jgi:hypothetical protein